MFLDATPFRAHHTREFGRIAIGPQLCVTGIEECADNAGLKGRLARQNTRRVQHVDPDTDRGQRSGQRLRMLEIGRIAKYIHCAECFELAVEVFPMHELFDQRTRAQQQRRLEAGRALEILPIAMSREAEQPAQQRRVEAWSDAQRRIGLQQVAQRHTDRAGRC